MCIRDMDKVSPLYLESDAVKYTLPERTTGLTLAGNINSTESDDVTTTLNFYEDVYKRQVQQ